MVLPINTVVQLKDKDSIVNRDRHQGENWADLE